MLMVRVVLIAALLSAALLSSLPALAEEGAKVEAAPIHTARPVPEPPDLVPAPAAAKAPTVVKCGKSAQPTKSVKKHPVKAAEKGGQ